ncbi:hypothetical protein L7F22_059592 [Adiantum nelumboides]|nr:hypothetical protein [Adiantum nelumboides]
MTSSVGRNRGRLQCFQEGGMSQTGDVAAQHQQYIGKVKYAAFQTQSAGRKRVVVATEQNVIASLNLRSGEIFWKHVLGELDSIDGLAIVLGKYVLTLSQQGSILRAWHLPDGQLVWETLLQSPGSNSMLSLTSIDQHTGSGKGKVVLVIGEKLLHGVSSIDGALLWTVESSNLSDNGETSIKKVIQNDEKSIYGIGLVGTSGFFAWEIDAKTGHLNSKNQISFQGELSFEELVVTDSSVIGLDCKCENIVFSSLNLTGQQVPHMVSIKGLIPSGEGRPRLLETLEGFFALQFSNQITFMKLGSLLNNVEIVQNFEGFSITSKAVELPGNKAALSLVQHVTADKIALHIVTNEAGEIKVSSELVDSDIQKGFVQKAYLNTYVRNDRSHGFRVLIVTDDASLSLFQQGEVVWNREDGLALIIEASTAELPLEKDGVSVAKVEHGLVEWLKGHWLKLKATLMLASLEEVAVVQSLRLKGADKTKMSRDHNGFRKLLIVLTQTGKLYALHTGDGRIVWSSFIPGFKTFSSSLGGKLTMLKLLPWQVPHKHALAENPVFLVAAKLVTADNQVGLLAWVDAFSGKEIKSAKLTYFIEQIIPLPYTDSAEQRLHIIIDDHANVHLFPSTDESLQLFLEHVPSTYFYTVDEEKGIITGFVVEGPQAASPISPSDGILFQSQKLWTIIFPCDSEKIITTATRKLDEAVHTQAKVLTNQDVLYKYLNKNTLFVATVAPRGSGTFGETSPEETWLVVYVIDTVTGRILYRLKHPSMHGPVHAVCSENWIVYHYFNVRAHRFEFSVIEMYDRNRVNNKNVLQVMLGKHNATAPLSSYSRVDLDIKTQSYFFLYSIKALTVTTTARGITGKQILAGNVGDQILALDKRFFDPRRTPEPTQAEKEDGIIPLTDAIPIHPQFYLSHAYQVEGLRGIISVPAGLESTSLVFAYGVDLFYSHTAPSRIYDSLTDEFNYALLLITIFALVIAIVTTWILSERKELKEKWK